MFIPCKFITKVYLTSTGLFQKFVDEAKKFLVVVGTLPCDRMETSDHREYDEVIRELRDTTETLMEMFKYYCFL